MAKTKAKQETKEQHGSQGEHQKESAPQTTTLQTTGERGGRQTSIIRGERRSEREEDEEGYYRSERSYGSFYRSIPLPEGVKAENANATFRNGVLEITLPAPERAEQRSRRLEIRAGTEGETEPRGRAKAAGQK